MRKRMRLGFWYRLVVVIVKPVLRLCTRRDWRGLENLPASGGFIAVANHVSEVDPLIVGEFLVDNGRPPRFLAKKELFQITVLRWIFEGAKQIPVDRNSTDASKALSAAVDALRNGECIFIYPEGSATRDPQLWPMKARTGVARLALLSRAPVVPIAQWGPQRILAYKARKPKLLPPTKVQVLAGPAVDLSAYYDRPITAELLHEVTDVVMHRVADLLSELRGEPAPTTFYDMKAQARMSEAS